MLDIIQINNGYKVSFQYKPWIKEAIKQLPGAKFNWNDKSWFVPETSGPALMNWAQPFLNKPIAAAVDIQEIEPLPELDIDIDEIIYHRERKAKGESYLLFPYQKNGVAYGVRKKQVINGDDMGLGKTAQSIATLVAGAAKCILIICPATLKENWKREWKIWAGREAIIINSRVQHTWHQYYKIGMCNVFICNYESLKKYFVESIHQPVDEQTGKKKPLRINHIKFKESIKLFDAVVVDELHRCKDGKTLNAKLTMGISKDKEWILGLTGTPVVNKPKDLISQLYIINKLQLFGGYKHFIDRYCQGFSEASNLKELNYLLHKHCFYRRLKKEVLHDLPDKMRNIIRTEIDNRAEYEKAENNLIDYLRDNLRKTDGEITTALRGEAMVLIGILKKIAARGKIEGMLDHIQEAVDAGEKIIVFAWHKDVVVSLKEHIPGALTIVGSDNLEQRQRAVDTFQNDPNTKVIICNIKSGGVGITLTASSRVSFIELPWHPAHADQAEDRAWRIGAKNSVTCTYSLGVNTIDEYIYDIIQKKRQIVAQVTGAENEIETSVVDDFINQFVKEKSILK